MTQDEFLAWAAFYREQPFDDLHRFHRPAALVAASMSGDLRAKLEFLAPEPVPEGLQASDLATLRAFGIQPGAVGS